jgi:hypothetical protein
VRLRRVVGTVAAVAFGTFLGAGPALGAITPRLVVSPATTGSIQTLTISASHQLTDSQVGQIQLFVPNGYALNSPSVGAPVGTATAEVVMQDVRPGVEEPMSGTVSAISPSDPTIAYEGATCDTSQHLAAWVVRLGSGKNALSFPIFVDATSGSDASFGPYVLVACFRAADLPITDPDRSPTGDVVESLTLSLTPFIAPTLAGPYLWRSLWTAFAPGIGTLDETSSVEAQSTVEALAGQITIAGSPTTVTVRGTKLELAIVTGSVLVNGQPLAGVVVRVRHGAVATKLVAAGRVGTGADGVYVQVVVMQQNQYVQASAAIPPVDLGPAGCQASFGEIPCLDATTTAGHVATAPLLIKR